MKPTWTSDRPRAASFCTIRYADATSVVSGFSHSTGTPASRQASTWASCAAPGEAIRTASTSGSWIAAIGSASARAPTSATAAALSARKSLTTTTREPRTRRVSASTWKEPIRPTPRTAMRRSRPSTAQGASQRLPMSMGAELHEAR